MLRFVVLLQFAPPGRSALVLPPRPVATLRSPSPLDPTVFCTSPAEQLNLLAGLGVVVPPSLDEVPKHSVTYQRRAKVRDAAVTDSGLRFGVADRVPAVPTHSPEHDLTLEVTSRELVHPSTPCPGYRGQSTNPVDLCNRAPASPTRHERTGSERC